MGRGARSNEVGGQGTDTEGSLGVRASDTEGAGIQGMADTRGWG